MLIAPEVYLQFEGGFSKKSAVYSHLLVSSENMKTSYSNENNPTHGIGVEILQCEMWNVRFNV